MSHENPPNENIEEKTLLETPITEESMFPMENTTEKVVEARKQDDESLIKEKEEELNKKYAELQKKVVNEGKQQSHGIPVPPIQVKHHWWRKIAVTLGLAGAMATLPQQAEGKSAEDSLKKQDGIERTIGGGEDSLKKKSNIKTYTSSKTKEGAITPTGLSNSFLENPYGVTEADISLIAEHYGFSTESNAAFQRDMYNFIKDNNPELIKEILEKYGQTEKGGSIDKNASLEEQIKGLIDNKLGVRDAFTIAQLKKIIEVIQEEQKSSPQEVIKEIPQPTGKYVINVRGDEPESRGVYFFFDTEKEFKEATDKIGGYSSREIKKGEGQATINMNADVFLDRYANGKEDLLGIAWERDGEKQYKFFAKETKSTTANYTDGFVKAQ